MSDVTEKEIDEMMTPQNVMNKVNLCMAYFTELKCYPDLQVMGDQHIILIAATLAAPEKA